AGWQCRGGRAARRVDEEIGRTCSGGPAVTAGATAIFNRPGIETVGTGFGARRGAKTPVPPGFLRRTAQKSPVFRTSSRKNPEFPRRFDGQSDPESSMRRASMGLSHSNGTRRSGNGQGSDGEAGYRDDAESGRQGGGRS